jgi:hypothetical protein
MRSIYYLKGKCIKFKVNRFVSLQIIEKKCILFFKSSYPEQRKVIFYGIERIEIP